MTDFDELIEILSVPRPNGSRALERTCRSLCAWLSRHAVPHRLQTIRYAPFYVEVLGVLLLVSQTALALAVWFRWGLLAAVLALVTVLGIVLEARGSSVVARLARGRGQNILLEFGAPGTVREIVLSAHYDSKTELFDHRWRALLLGYLPVGMAVALVLGLGGLIEVRPGAEVTPLPHSLAVALTVSQLLFMGALGLNYALGRLVPPSRGAVDDGAACAILLALAREFAGGGFRLERSKVTIALFTGEEVAGQGARAYVASRRWPLPTAALNLELMGQDGDYLLLERLGWPLRRYATSSAVNDEVASTIAELTGRAVRRSEAPVVTDSVPFLAAGLAATTLGSLDRAWGAGGLHRPSDGPERLDRARLSEGVALLRQLLRRFDREPSAPAGPGPSGSAC